MTDVGVEWGKALAWGVLGYLASKLLPRRVRHHRIKAAARRVAAHWEDAHLDSPWDLRAFLDLRLLWTTDEIATRLKINSPLAVEILRATGYSRRRGTSDWVLGSSLEAQRRRQKFDAQSELSR